MFGVFRATTRKNEEIRGSQKAYPINRKIRVSARFLCQPACHPYFNGLRAGFLCRKESGDKELLAFGGYPLENLLDPKNIRTRFLLNLSTLRLKSLKLSNP